MERHDHSELQTSVGLVCDTLRLGQTGPEPSSLRIHLTNAFERAQTLVRESLHLKVR
jgi:hypothetical protein